MQRKEYLERILREAGNVYECQKVSLDIILEMDSSSFFKYAKRHGKDVFCSINSWDYSDLYITADTVMVLSEEELERYELKSEFWEFIDIILFPELYGQEEDENGVSAEDIKKDFSQYEKEVLEEIQKDNEQIDCKLLNEVVSASLFVIIDGVKVGIKDSPNKDMAYRRPYSRLQDILNNPVIMQNRKSEEEYQKLCKDLESKIKHDERFWGCSSQKRREIYARDLWNKDENRWLRAYFPDSKGRTAIYGPSDRFLFYLDDLYKKNNYHFRMALKGRNT